MRRKGFTLVELLVVIAIIAMLLAILMPALAKVKILAYQMLCGTNLKGIANATLVYSQDNNEKYPVAGLTSPTWNNSGTGGNPAGGLYQNGNNWQWDNPDRAQVRNRATVSACLFLLVKYADVSTSSFVCKASSKQKKMNLATLQADTTQGANTQRGVPITPNLQAKDATDCWDFSNLPSRYCSYAYSYPWNSGTRLTSSSKSGMAVAADLNPWITTTSEDAPIWNAGMLNSVGVNATPRVYDSPQLILMPPPTQDQRTDSWIAGNSLTHDQLGQNVLFNDMHVEFSKQPNPDSAVQNDNIYTIWNTTAGVSDKQKKQRGTNPSNITNRPEGKDDSYLVQW